MVGFKVLKHFRTIDILAVDVNLVARHYFNLRKKSLVKNLSGMFRNLRLL